MNIRASGVLLHITSLPSGHGVGDLGPWAYKFVDFLSEAGQMYWQILPIGPTSPAIGNSPYSSFSAFAGNPLLISPARLVAEGFLTPDEAPGDLSHNMRRVDYEDATTLKENLLRKAFERKRRDLERDVEFLRFCNEHRDWLDDYAMFVTLKSRFGGAEWVKWPKEYRDRNPEAMEQWRFEAGLQIEFEKFVQHLFFAQWRDLKEYCREKKVHIIGDVPIYVTYDSADVWVNWRYFKLDQEKRPVFVAGVPPDYFSETGQRWGNPVYDWDRLKKDEFLWWVRRAQHNFNLFDHIRLDHFRGFAGYWEIPAEEETAVNGEWVDAPGEELFTSLCRHLPTLPIIAEDLGVITADVRELKQRFGFPGMKILQFGFSGDPAGNPDAPHNHEKNCVLYTGTHDNNTVLGWFRSEASDEERTKFLNYLGLDREREGLNWDFIRLAMMSVADTVIFPVQDILGLDRESRMNTPSVAKGNWEWRLLPEEMDRRRYELFIDMTRFFGRA